MTMPTIRDMIDNDWRESRARRNPIAAYRKAHPENVVWSPGTGWTDDYDPDLDRWADEGGYVA